MTDFLYSVYQDVRVGIRGFAKRPWFTGTVVLTLGLGIGVTSGMFSLADWLLFSPIPGVQNADRLGIVRFGTRSGASYSPSSVSYANLDDIVAGSPAVRGMAGWQGRDVNLAVADALPQRTDAQFVMPTYFDLLGTVPSAGRMLMPVDDRPPSGDPVAVISHRLAQSFFDDPTSAIGKTVRVNTTAITIVGVAPPGFQGIERTGQVDIWLPARLYIALYRLPAERFNNTSRADGLHHDFLMGLAPNASFEQAEQQLIASTRALADAFPNENAKFVENTSHVFPGLGLTVWAREIAGQIMRLLAGVIGLVLLITCTNVANLFLFRGVHRQRESMIRRALGAGLVRLVRQRLTESVVLSLTGGLLGLILAVGLVIGLRSFELPGVGELVNLTVDWRVAVFAAGLAVATGILCGIIPAISGARSGGKYHIGSPLSNPERQNPRLRLAFTFVQFAASLTLLVAALALVRTVRSLTAVELGFEQENLASFWIDLDSQHYDADRAVMYQGALLQRVRSIPGVTVVSVAKARPFLGYTFNERVRLPGQPREDAHRIASNGVSPSYFDTLRLPLLSGRTFTTNEAMEVSDPASYPVMVNQRLAALLFGDEVPAVGRVLALGAASGESDRVHRIIGVVENSKWVNLEEDFPPQLYVPFVHSQPSFQHSFTFIVRTQQGISLPSGAIREVAATIDPLIPLGAPQILSDDVAKQFAEERLLATTFLSLGVLAVVLAAVGLYGLLAQGVAERMTEFGIRMAIGAKPVSIFKHATRESVFVGTLGIVVGLAGAVGMMKLLESRLFGVSVAEPALYASAIGILAAVMGGATAIPAHNATRIDPATALRTE